MAKGQKQLNTCIKQRTKGQRGKSKFLWNTRSVFKSKRAVREGLRWQRMRVRKLGKIIFGMYETFQYGLIWMMVLDRKIERRFFLLSLPIYAESSPFQIPHHLRYRSYYGFVHMHVLHPDGLMLDSMFIILIDLAADAKSELSLLKFQK